MNITPITMVYGTYNYSYSYWGESKPTFTSRLGPHISTNISAHLPKDPHEPPHEPHLHVHPLHPPRRNNTQDLSRQRRQGRHRGGGVVGPSELDGPALRQRKKCCAGDFMDFDDFMKFMGMIVNSPLEYFGTLIEMGLVEWYV